MEETDKTKAVGRMQRYILENLDDVTLEGLRKAAGYSKYHAVRVFREATGKTPFEYIRTLRLTKAAEKLRDSGDKIIDVALQSGFDSHDGFTRAFRRQFEMTPQKYSRETPPVRFFVHYPIESYYHLKDGEKAMNNEKVSRTVTVTAVERLARKLILLRAMKTTGGDYFAYCEEMGCDWEGLLGSIVEKYAPPALLTLPDNLMKAGTSNTAAGVEVPADYAKPIPDNYDIIDLPPCSLLFFAGAPYENEEDFCIAIEIVGDALEQYLPELYGWQAAPELAPRFNFGASEVLGARMAIPVKAK
jgi:AraC-like DNA-binding protein